MIGRDSLCEEEEAEEEDWQGFSHLELPDTWSDRALLS